MHPSSPFILVDVQKNWSESFPKLPYNFSFRPNLILLCAVHSKFSNKHRRGKSWTFPSSLFVNFVRERLRNRELKAADSIDFAGSLLCFKFLLSVGWVEFPSGDIRQSFLFVPSGQGISVNFDISGIRAFPQISSRIVFASGSNPCFGIVVFSAI
jgi:hypothetical protein